MQNNLIQSTATFVKRTLEDAEAGHDWWHIQRVWNMTNHLLDHEDGDPIVCELAALLHDIADYKFHGGDENAGPLLAENFLREEGLAGESVDRVIDIVRNISFKGGLNVTGNKSQELMIVQDADRLDAMGAIGIARAFHYGGFKNRLIYDPDVKPRNYHNVKDYLKSSAPTINHFYEKLLLLKDEMNTPTARRIAEKRHKFMEEFLEKFFSEWNGEV